MQCRKVKKIYSGGVYDFNIFKDISVKFSKNISILADFGNQ